MLPLHLLAVEHSYQKYIEIYKTGKIPLSEVCSELYEKLKKSGLSFGSFQLLAYIPGLGDRDFSTLEFPEAYSEYGFSMTIWE